MSVVSLVSMASLVPEVSEFFWMECRHADMIVDFRLSMMC